MKRLILSPPETLTLSPMKTPPDPRPNSAPLEGLEIFQQWDMYDRIVHGNWMRHRELWTAIDQTIADHGHAIKVLDVGSGDGAMAFGGLSDQQLVYLPLPKRFDKTR